MFSFLVCFILTKVPSVAQWLVRSSSMARLVVQVRHQSVSCINKYPASSVEATTSSSNLLTSRRTWTPTSHVYLAPWLGWGMFFYIIISLHHYIITSLCRYIIISLHHYIVATLYRYIIISVHHYTITLYVEI